MNAAAADVPPQGTQEETPAPIIALYPGRCTRCERRFPRGASIVPDGLRKYAHWECVEAQIEPATPPPVDDQLDEARLALLEVARRARHVPTDDAPQALAEVYERATGTLLWLNQQRTRGRG